MRVSLHKDGVLPSAGVRGPVEAEETATAYLPHQGRRQCDGSTVPWSFFWTHQRAGACHKGVFNLVKDLQRSIRENYKVAPFPLLSLHLQLPTQPQEPTLKKKERVDNCKAGVSILFHDSVLNWAPRERNRRFKTLTKRGLLGNFILWFQGRIRF